MSEVTGSFQPLTSCAFHPTPLSVIPFPLRPFNPPPPPPFISPTFISHHLIPASMLLAPSTLFPHTFAFVSTISPSLLLCLHVFCLVMAFVKGVLDQLLTAPAAEPDTSSHPTLIRSLPSSYALVKVSY